MTVGALFPILSTRDLPTLVGFYEQALDATATYRFRDGDEDVYVALALGPASLGIAHDPHTAEAVGSGDRAALWVYVDDVDHAFDAAVRAGADVVQPPALMPWGERVADVRDPAGHLVHLGQALATET
jgi:uncharacterized glyoxalase superfamily protein PhnB